MATYGGLNIVTDGLVLALDAANARSYPGSGTTWGDLSGNVNNGTLTNGPTFNPANGGSIVFDGIDDYVPLTNAITLGNTFTILSWIKLSTLAGGDYIVYGTDANGSDNWFGINANAAFIFATQTSDVNNFTLSGGSISSTSLWYLIGATIDTTIVKVYLNGAEVNTVTKAFTIGPWNSTGAGGSAIGRRGNIGQRYFPGSVSLVQAYNRVLSPSEISQNYNAQKSRFNL